MSRHDPSTLWLCWHGDALVGAISFIIEKSDELPCIIGLLNNRGDALCKAYERFGGHFLQVTDYAKGVKPGVKTEDILHHLQEIESCLITPDGPRGPRHVARKGVRSLLQNPAVSAVWLTFSVSRKITLPRWDRLIIPLPFCSIEVTELTDAPTSACS